LLKFKESSIIFLIVREVPDLSDFPSTYNFAEQYPDAEQYPEELI